MVYKLSRTLSLYLAISLSLAGSFAQGFVGSSRELLILSEYGEEENINRTLNQNPREAARPIGLGAASGLLLTALYQDIPVLVPQPLWSTIIKHKKLFDTFAHSEKNRLRELYGHYERFKLEADREVFRKRCRYLKAFYDQLIKHARDNSSIDQLKYAISSDPFFRKAAPASVRDIPPNTWFELSHYLMCSYVPIDRYSISEITLPDKKNPVSFLLFLPRSSTLALPREKQIISSSSFGFSERELALGLKVDRFPLVTDPFSSRYISSKRLNQTRDYPYSLIPLLKNLFITQAELPEGMRQRWTIMLMGHGAFSDGASTDLDKATRRQATLEMLCAQAHQEGRPFMRERYELEACKRHIEELNHANRVTGLPLAQFRELLLFLEHSIRTRLLFYSSCSAGGKQAVDAFTLNSKQLTLSFPVLLDTLVEAPSLSTCPVLPPSCVVKGITQGPPDISNLVRPDTGQLMIESDYDLATFFTLARDVRVEPSVLHSLIHSVSPAHINPYKSSSSRFQSRLTIGDINNSISIRLPGLSYFSVIDGSSRYLTLTDKLIQDTSYASLSIPPNKELILLASPTFSYTIELGHTPENAEFPAIISAIPGKAAHYIEHLKAPYYTLSDIITKFFTCERLATSKLIRLNKLTCINDLSFPRGKNMPQVFENVLIINRAPFSSSKENYRNGLFFSLDGNDYSLTWPDTALLSLSHMPRVHALDREQATQNRTRIMRYFSKDTNTLKDTVPTGCHTLSVEQIAHNYALYSKIN
jgi:hypothetical protein